MILCCMALLLAGCSTGGEIKTEAPTQEQTTSETETEAPSETETEALTQEQEQEQAQKELRTAAKLSAGWWTEWKWWKNCPSIRPGLTKANGCR